jgi:hypothetical protein
MVKIKFPQVDERIYKKFEELAPTDYLEEKI